MNILHTPKNDLEKFGEKIYLLLVENFSQSFYVGGMVRDLLLKKPVTDIDIATVATPDQVEAILKKNNISHSTGFKRYGVIVAIKKSLSIEIATLRTDKYTTNRFPDIAYVRSPQIDSKRRDFTVNALYLLGKTGEIYDYQAGITDINNRIIRFIGTPNTRIKEDPLRIVRALRFALQLHFTIEKKTFEAIKNNFSLLAKLTQTKINSEIHKLKNKTDRITLAKVINNEKSLDKDFKMS